jgi:hypothetical protein
MNLTVSTNQIKQYLCKKEYINNGNPKSLFHSPLCIAGKRQRMTGDRGF